MREREASGRTDAEHERLGRWMRTHARDSFGPGFEDRVMRRIAEESAQRPARKRAGVGADPFGGVDAAIAAIFPRLAVAALVALVVAGAYCVWGVEDRTPLEALVGLSPISIENAYDLGEDLEGETGLEETQPAGNEVSVAPRAPGRHRAGGMA